MLRIRTREHCHVTLAIDILVVERRVLRLLSILRQKVDIALLETRPHVEGICVFGKIQLVSRSDHHLVIFLLVLVHERSTECDICSTFRHRFRPLVETQFQVCTTHQSLVMMPITTLLTRERLQLHTLHRTQNQSSTSQRVVDAKTTLFVGTKNETRPKLLIIIAKREFRPFVLAFHIKIRNAPSFEVLLKAWQWMFQKLETGTCIHILTLSIHLGIRVGQCPFIIILGTNLFVFLRNENITLNASAHMDGIIATFL